MSHKKLGSVKKKLRSAHYDKAELLGLIRFLMALLASSSGKSKLTKAQRKSLAITERQLGVRSASKKHSRKRGKKQRTTTRRSTRKSKSRTAHQKRFAALARKYHGRIPKGTKV